jgi:hypothetical protein
LKKEGRRTFPKKKSCIFLCKNPIKKEVRRPTLMAMALFVMAMALFVILLLITCLDSIEGHSNIAELNAEPSFAESNFVEPSEFWNKTIHPLGTSDIPRFFIMPKA